MAKKADGLTVAVLGGFGLMAEAALHDLAADSRVRRVLAADITLARAKAVLERIPNRGKIRAVQLDLNDRRAALKALEGADCLLNCSWYEFNLAAMQLALALRAHYVDLGGLYHMTRKQLRLGKEFDTLGLTAVLGCGSTPGITNMMVAKMAETFERVDDIGIYDAAHDPSQSEDSFLPPFSIRTMLDEYVKPAPILERGRMIDAPAHSRQEELDFKAPIGRVSLGVVIHSETATLPQYLKAKGLKNVSFKIYYPDVVKRQLGMLIAMGLHSDELLQVNGSKVKPRHVVTALAQAGAAKGGGIPNDFEVLRVKIKGVRDGRAVAKTWDCEIRPTRLLSAGAMGVGFAGSIAAIMACRGDVLKLGAAAPESALEPDVFFKELAQRKVFSLTEKIEQPLEVG